MAEMLSSHLPCRTSHLPSVRHRLEQFQLKGLKQLGLVGSSRAKPSCGKHSRTRAGCCPFPEVLLLLHPLGGPELGLFMLPRIPSL